MPTTGSPSSASGGRTSCFASRNATPVAPVGRAPEPQLADAAAVEVHEPTQTYARHLSSPSGELHSPRLDRRHRAAGRDPRLRGLSEDRRAMDAPAHVL